MRLIRFALVAFCAIAGVVAAIPAADQDDFRATLAAFRKAKTKEERLDLLRGKKGFEIGRFVEKLFAEQDGPLARGEFAEVERLQLWAEEAATLMEPERREICEFSCMLGRGRLELARERFTEAAAIYKNLLITTQKPRFQSGRVLVLMSLASVQSKQGDYINGLKTIEDARALLAGLEEGQRELIEATLLVNLGWLHAEVGEYAEAEKSLKESVRLAEKNKNAEAATAARINLAIIATYRGKYAEAITTYESLLDDSREKKNKLLEITILNQLAAALAEYGRVGEALRRVEEARKIAVSLKQRRSEATILYNLAIEYSKLEAFDDAQRYLRDSIALFQDVDDKGGIARCMKLAGLLQLLTGQKAEAEKTFAEALKLVKANGSQSDLAELIFAVGVQYFDAKEWKKAEEKFADAVRAFQKLNDPRRILLSRELRLLCLGNMNDDRFVTEFAEYKKDESDFKDPYAALRMPYYTARGAVMRKSWREAIAEAQRGIRENERRRLLLEVPQWQVSRSASSHLPRLYSVLATAQVGKDDPVAAFATIDRAKGWVLSQLLDRSRGAIHKGMTQDERDEETKLREAVMAAAGKSAAQMRFANATPGKADALQKEQDEAEANYEKFQRGLALAHPELRSQRGELPPVDLVALQKDVFAREPNLAILSYLVSWDRLLIAVVTVGDKPGGPARVVVRSVSVEEKELAEAAERFWKLCQNAKAGRPLSDDLYKWLIEPAAKDIAGKKHLLIVPCHPLLAVPFQALAENQDTPYLIEQFAISYAPSVSALLEMRRRGDSVRGPGRADRLQMLAIGGVKEDIPASGPEAKEVAKVFGNQSRILLAKGATRPEVMKAMPQARFIHFATHGLVNPLRPLFSALAVSPVGKDDDERLYAHDVLNLDLSAEMVVLSACDTGRGRDYRGEGTVGLAWAFFVAGTPTTVVSQWQVSDKATAELMRVFYERLRSGKDGSKAESLQQAALALLKADRTRHPKYWAPFVMIGDWRK